MKNDIDRGFRFGTKPHDNLGSEWTFVKGKHPLYEKIANDSRLGPLIESKIRNIMHKQEKALYLTSYMLCMFFGGHVSTRVIAAVRERGLKDTDDPAANFSKAKESMPAKDFDGMPLE